MQLSKNFLPDVNVWLALASARHIHARLCGLWLDSVDSEAVAFCRISQMGLLRLLTTKAVMQSDVLSSRDAWRAYKKTLSDHRITFVPEPLALEAGME